MAQPGWYPVPGGRRWWDGEQWAEHFIPDGEIQAYAARRSDDYRTNHILHLLLTVFTFGLWAPVWLIVGVSNSNARARLDAPVLRAQAGLPPASERRRREPREPRPPREWDRAAHLGVIRRVDDDE